MRMRLLEVFFNSKIKKTFTIFPQFFFIELFDYLFHYFFRCNNFTIFNGKNKMINKKFLIARQS